MNLSLQDLKDGGIAGAVAIFIFKQIWGWIVGSAKTRLETLQNNTEAIKDLSREVKSIRETIQVIPKLEKDVFYAHEKIRSMSNEKSGQDPTN